MEQTLEQAAVKYGCEAYVEYCIQHGVDAKAAKYPSLEKAFKDGAQWARNIIGHKYEFLIGYIDIINHSSLTKDQHEILDKILQESKVTEDELRRIRLVYTPNNPTLTVHYVKVFGHLKQK